MTVGTNRKSVQVTNFAPIPSGDTATELVAIVATFVVPAGLAVNDVIEMGPLAANMVVADLTVDFPDLDSNVSPTIKFDAGILTGNYQDAGSRDCDASLIAASTAAQAGGIARMSSAGALSLGPNTTDKSWGLKVNTAAATLTTGGTIKAILYARQKIEGV